MDNCTTPLKRCTKCGNEYPLTHEFFYRTKRSKSGFHAQCKPCFNELNRKWKQANHDKVLEGSRRQYRNNTEKRRKSSRDWRKRNPEKVQASNRRHRLENPDSLRLWRAANPDKDRAAIHRRLARKRSLPDTLTPKQWQRCFEWWNYTCAYCGAQRDFWNVIEADHFIPLGSPDCTGTTALNIVPACRSCNSSKNNNNAAEWLQFKFPRKWRKVLKRIETYFEWVREQD